MSFKPKYWLNLHIVTLMAEMKSLIPILLLALSLSLQGCGGKGYVLTGGDDVLVPGYETGMGKQSSREPPDWRKYRLDTVNGDRVITLYDNALGEEELMRFSIISATKKRSTIYCEALLDADTVVLLDLNPGLNRPYLPGETYPLNVRRITRFRVPYHSLPLKVFVFENDTIWQHFDHSEPMYLRLDDNMRLEHQDIIETTLNL